MDDSDPVLFPSSSLRRRTYLLFLRWSIMLRDVRHHPVRLWHWSAKWPVFGVIFALAVGLISIGEYGFGMGLICLSALSLVSKLWHSEGGWLLRSFGTFFVACGLLMAVAVTWDAKGDGAWSRLPHAWHKLKPPAKAEVSVPAPYAAVPGSQTLTLKSLFERDTPGVIRIGNDKSTLYFNKNAKHVRIDAVILVDTITQTYSLSFFIPHSDLTNDVCSDLATKNSQTYKFLRKLLHAMDSGLDAETPLPSNLMTVQHPIFSGRIFIYHEDKIPLLVRAKLDDTFTKNGMAVEFRGIDYVLAQSMARDIANTLGTIGH